ncbi:MAG: 2-oxoacid:ferredoxin oxidoreductase subunit beta [Pseudomonadota bacterium]
MAFNYEHYLREDKFPHILCAGCSHGSILKAIIRAIDALGLHRDETAMISGIGCSSRIPGYVDLNTLHTTHGRSLAFGTGIKFAKPELTVIAVSGDGDATAIGGNHFIHACRRNLDMTLFVFNNFIYGMTGGQFSPTTPQTKYATTAPYGMVEPNFDIAQLAIGAGATFVAKTTAYHAATMHTLLAKAIAHKGFSVVEILSGCPTAYGRKNDLKTPVSLLNWFKDIAVPKAKADSMTEEELNGKTVIGILHEEKREEFLEGYNKLVEGVQERKMKM